MPAVLLVRLLTDIQASIADIVRDPGGETVAFSARIQVLVSKLGRSSKPSPRYLVIVGDKGATARKAQRSHPPL